MWNTRSFGVGFLLALASLTAGSPSIAGVIMVTGEVTPISPPASVAVGARESNTQVILFNESSATTIPARGISVDAINPGTYHGGGSAPNPGTIAAGTLVDSYFLHSDPVGSPSTGVEFTGSVTFNVPVLGLIFLSNALSNTDASLGHPGTTYPTGDASRGLESEDTVTLSSDRRTVTVDFFTHASVDEVRIITAVPEPASLVQFGLGAVGVAAAFYYRRRARTASSPSSGTPS